MNKIIILGTAHLSTTPGKRSPDGKFRECVFSREIVARVKAALTEMGYTVYVDYEPLEPNLQMKAASASGEQTKELAYRVGIVNNICRQHGAANCCYVSIHVNAAGNGGWRDATGFSVFVSANSSNNSKKLAQALYVEADIRGLKGNRCVPKEKYWMANYYVLRRTACPAVLTENLFQDNRADVAILQSEVGKQKIVNLHVVGIVNYLNSLP